MSSSSIRGKILELLRRGKSLYEIERELGIEPKELAKEVLRFYKLRGKHKVKVTKMDVFIYLHERGASREEVVEVMGASKEWYYGMRNRVRMLRGYSFPRRKSRVDELVEYVRKELDVDEIAKRMGVSRATLMQIISRARKMGLVRTKGKGRNYRVYLAEGTDGVREDAVAV